MFKAVFDLGVYLVYISVSLKR
uniref:Uncharacterized protein n=1 Tax=Tetranychus urticae TaxID=32264 RepID=T1KBY5_TETUR